MKKRIKLALCALGSIILTGFLISTTAAVVWILVGFFGKYDWIGSLRTDTWEWLKICLYTIIIEAVIFWVGILLVYFTSTQLGLRYRLWGLALGMIPIANLVMLFIILKTTYGEVFSESKRMRTNRKRRQEELCKTKYPILMVHGVFFRDFEHFNYWGRIPDELLENGATIFYGNHNSAAAVRESAKELKKRILEIVEKTGCEKVNIIAHSKGGLDSRCAISLEGMAPYVASLTTINTPHRGCEFADYLLNVIGEKQQNAVATTYNMAAAALGDFHPDFLAAVYDLTHENCTKLNEEVKDAEGVYYQSVGSKINNWYSGRFPLNLTTQFVRNFDGYNDGLVGEESFPWGEDYQFLSIEGKRGLSHADMIDLNRENFKGFDVREFYVELVHKLKEKGF